MLTFLNVVVLYYFNHAILCFSHYSIFMQITLQLQFVNCFENVLVKRCFTSQKILEKNRDIHICPCAFILFLIINTGLQQRMTLNCHLGSTAQVRNSFWCAFTEFQLMFIWYLLLWQYVHATTVDDWRKRLLIFYCTCNFAFFQNSI